jgi:phage tail-like protein
MSLFAIPEDILAAVKPVDLEPIKGYSFLVHIEGLLPGSYILSGFNEVAGLEKSIDSIAVVSSGDSRVWHYNRGVKDAPVVLRRGLCVGRELYDWIEEVANWDRGRPDYHRSVTIISLGQLRVDANYEAWSWQLVKSAPTRWTLSGLNSGQNQLAIEELELSHQGIKKSRSVFDNVVGEILGKL